MKGFVFTLLWLFDLKNGCFGSPTDLRFSKSKAAKGNELAKVLVNVGKSGDACSEDLVELEKCEAIPCNSGNNPR